MKMDVYLFEYDMPVIKYCPKKANLVSSSSMTIQLNDIINVEHISKFSKQNVLSIDFPLHSLLLSFKSKERMEMWMSELLCLTGNKYFTCVIREADMCTIIMINYCLEYLVDTYIINIPYVYNKICTLNSCYYAKVI